MCGIAGLYDLRGDPVPGDRIRAMCDLIAHRGPDDSDSWIQGPVGLGHRRLSIIDLSPRGRHPMPNEDGTLRLVFNGEIYNYRDIRTRLLTRGHTFRSASDSEVVVHLYEEEGLEFVGALNGMFAFALWDESRRRLLLARDRFGVKPLYYTVCGHTLAFASEVKAFLALPEFQPSPDVFGLAEHFTFQNTFGDRTFFRDVKLLPAGHYLVCQDGVVETRGYWDLRFQPDGSIGLQEWAGVLREQFEASVTRQLMSDVPLGAYLSGGVDSAALTAVAVRQIPRMRTFTCGFELPEGATELERYFDEREASAKLARRLGTIHREIKLGPDAMAAVLPHVVWHLDEPRVGISYQIYHLARLVARHVTVVLSGTGGDELFAGYPWRYEPMLRTGREDCDAVYYRQSIRFFTDGEKRLLFTDEVNHALGDFSTFESFRNVLRGTDARDPLSRALYFDFKTFLNGLLIVEDKLGMAHSVEGRVPFLDNEFADTVARIPSQFKLRPGESKIAFRSAMRGWLSDETLSRRKQGFIPPDQSWYKRESAGYIRDLILGPRALDRGYFQPAYLRQMLDDHLHDRRNHRALIWSLMCFEWWNRLFVDRDPVPAPGGVHAGAAGIGAGTARSDA